MIQDPKWILIIKIKSRHLYKIKEIKFKFMAYLLICKCKKSNAQRQAHFILLMISTSKKKRKKEATEKLTKIYLLKKSTIYVSASINLQHNDEKAFALHLFFNNFSFSMQLIYLYIYIFIKSNIIQQKLHFKSKLITICQATDLLIHFQMS